MMGLEGVEGLSDCGGCGLVGSLDGSFGLDALVLGLDNRVCERGVVAEGDLEGLDYEVADRDRGDAA